MMGAVPAVAALLGLIATGAMAAARLRAASGPADRLLLIQLLTAKTIAGCLAASAAFDQPALADAGLALALLGAVGAAAFGQGGGRR